MRRSDFFRMDNKHSFFASKPDYMRNKQYLNYNDNNNRDDDGDNDTTTTDSTDDYLPHDTESVDRLALDGETRDPINSSTNDSYNF